MPGKPGYYDLDKNRFAYPIKNVILYRFSEDMFFANIKILQSDIDQAVEDTQDEIKAVIIDSEAVNSIDFTAADAIGMLSDSLEKRGIRFYMTGHTDKINAQMRHLGLGHLIDEGRVRRTVLSALKDAGIEVPCVLDIPEKDKSRLERVGNRAYPQGEEYTLEEFVWAFGEGAGKEIRSRAAYVLAQIRTMDDVHTLAVHGVDSLVSSWGFLGELDEELLLRSMLSQLDNLPEELKGRKEEITKLIETRRDVLKDRLLRDHPEMTAYLEESRSHRMERKYSF